MPQNTFGQTLNAGGGSPVPTQNTGAGTAQSTTTGADVKGSYFNPNYAFQVPPTLSASFSQTPQGVQKAPAVVTSSAAEDHVTGMTTAANQATQDALNLASHNGMTAAAAQTPQDVSNTNTGETPESGDTPAANDIDSLLTSLGLDTSGMSDQQKSVIAEDTAQIQADQQAQNQVETALASMSAGTFPLTPAEQAQVSAVSNSYAGSLNAAQNYLQSVTNGATALVAKGNYQMYSPQIALGVIRNAITAGQAKVDQVNSRIVSSMSKLTNALQNQDYKAATTLYKQIGSDITLRTKEIDDINKVVTTTQKQMVDESIKANDAFMKTKTDLLKGLGSAPQSVKDAVAGATDLTSLFAATGPYLSAGTGTGFTGWYSTYYNQAVAAGKTPLDPISASQIYNKAPKTPATPTSALLNFAPGSNGSSVSSSVKLDQTGITNWLADFAGSGGKISLPSLGIGNAAAAVKIGILNGIAQRNHELGISGSQLAAILSGKTAAQQALNVISRNQGMMQVAEGTATKNFDLVLQLMQNAPPKSINPLLNEFIQTGSIQIGNSDVKPLRDAILTSLNEYAKVITGQTSGAAVSDAARREAQSLLSAADTADTIRKVITVAKTEMGNRSTSYADAKQKEYDLIQATHGDAVTVPPDENNDPMNAALNQSMTDEQATQKLLNLGADGRFTAQINKLRTDNPTMTPVQIYQIVTAK